MGIYENIIGRALGDGPPETYWGRKEKRKKKKRKRPRSTPMIIIADWITTPQASKEWRGGQHKASMEEY